MSRRSALVAIAWLWRRAPSMRDSRSSISSNDRPIMIVRPSSKPNVRTTRTDPSGGVPDSDCIDPPFACMRLDSTIAAASDARCDNDAIM
jgi:hypothetical protein